MFTFLLVVHAIIASALVAVILMQRSEGGGLGMGGSPSGLMSARGAADFLTRATTILATVFVVMSIGLAAYAGVQRASRPIDTSLARPGGAGEAPVPAGDVPVGGDPLAGAAAAAGNGSVPPVPNEATPATPPVSVTPTTTRPRAADRTAPAPRVIERESAVPTTLRRPAAQPAPTLSLPTPKADSTPAPAVPAPAPANGAVPIAQ